MNKITYKLSILPPFWFRFKPLAWVLSCLFGIRWNISGITEDVVYFASSFNRVINPGKEGELIIYLPSGTMNISLPAAEETIEEDT